MIATLFVLSVQAMLLARCLRMSDSYACDVIHCINVVFSV